MTIPDFIAWADAQSDDRRYELLKGEIVAQAVPVPRHARIVKSMTRLLDTQLPAECEVLPGVGIAAADDSALEPDLAVFCSRRVGNEERYAPDPTIVIEVLSPSTARYDMGGKAEAYQRIESLEHYLIVDPADRFVIIRSRGPEANWGIVKVAREDFFLDPPGIAIDHAAIFAGMD